MNADEYNKRILAELSAIRKAVEAMARAQASGGGARGGSSGGKGSTQGAVADDRELDSDHGDPLIKSMPKRWEGEDFSGCHYSETSPEFLECLAGFKDWQAQKDEENDARDARGRPKAPWARKDAARARGWAARLRAGWQPPGQGGGGSSAGAGGDQWDGTGADPNDDVPFITCEPNRWGL